MNRQDLRQLIDHRSPNSVSILARTHRTSPDNKRDPIQVKNLVNQAKERLLAENERRAIAPLLSRIDELVDEIDWPHALDGLAIFASDSLCAVQYLPFEVENRVIIDETFATRDVVHALSRSPRYRVVVLSEKPTRLYEGVRDDLEEVVDHGFPMVHEGRGGERPLMGGPGVNVSQQRDDAHRQFFRKVDAGLAAAMAGDPTPLVVVGVTRYHAFFDEVSAHTGKVIASLTGAHDKTPAHELGRMAWPEVDKALKERAQAWIGKVNEAVGANRVSSGLVQVWRAAAEGRGATVVVDANYAQPARLSDDGLDLTLVDDPTPMDVLDDAVDDVIELVLQKGGEVVFVDGGLDRHDRIALLLRF